MCRAHAAVRHLLGGLLEAEGPLTIVDTEAGLEHLSRGTARYVDTLLVVMEPYYKALETARRAAELGQELGIPHIRAVANKVRDKPDTEAIRQFASAHALDVVSELPFDEVVRRADLEGRAVVDMDGSVAVHVLEQLAGSVLAWPRRAEASR